MSATASTATLCHLPPDKLEQYLLRYPGFNPIAKQKIIKQNERWNRAIQAGVEPKKLEENIAYLLPKGMKREDVPGEMQPTLDRYAMADALALKNQATLKRNTKEVIGLALVAMISLEVGHVLGHWHEPLWLTAFSYGSLLLFFACWFIAIGIERGARRAHVQNQQQDFRALAEGLRIQFYCQWGGITSDPYQCYPARHHSDIDWHLFALEEWKAKEPVKTADAGKAVEYWTTNQLDYYLGKHRDYGSLQKNADANRYYYRMSKGLIFYPIVILGIPCAAMIIIDWIYHPDEWLTISKYAVLFIIALCLLAAAACYAYRERFAFAEHESAYKKMAKVHLEAVKKLKAQEDATTILSKLSQEASDESLDWLLLHRERHAISAGF